MARCLVCCPLGGAPGVCSAGTCVAPSGSDPCDLDPFNCAKLISLGCTNNVTQDVIMRPFELTVTPDPLIAGAVVLRLKLMAGLNIDPIRMALLCQRAENEFVGMNCGILDQYSSAMGRAGSVLLLDCRDLSSETKPLAKVSSG